MRFVGERLPVIEARVLANREPLVNLAIQLCKAAYVLVKNPEGRHGLREMGALFFLEKFATQRSRNEQLVNSAVKVISILLN